MKSGLIVILLAFSSSALAAPLVPRAAPRSQSSDIPMKVGLKPDLGLAMPGGALGYWGVGNGGDWLRLGFARARDYAAQVVMRVKPGSLRNIQQDDLREWIIDNQKYLAADILQSEHIWELEAKPTCAWTVQPGEGEKVPTAHAIQLSYPSCRQNVDSFLKAAQILIHESVHHFSGDETTADRVAIGIIDAWQAGLMDALPITLEGAPAAAQKQSALWTGEQMVIVGGYVGETQESLARISAYDPKTERWTQLEWPQWLAARHDAQVLWTGEEVFIWGGYRSQGTQTEWLYDGALYRPDTKVWTAVKAPVWWSPKPTTWDADPRQTAVWTGDRAIVYGGVDAKTERPLGAVFDAKARAWTSMNTAPGAPLRIAGQSALWNGQRMLIWGGYQGRSDGEREITDEGASYDPQRDVWTPMNRSGAPSPRAGHQAVWTGKKMIVWSGGGIGSQGGLNATGGMYDPATDSWTPMATELVIERVGHKVVWNGEEMLLVGGRSNRLKSYFGEVYGFHPETQRWRLIASGQTPTPRFYPSMVWTGSSALIWGGMGADNRSLRTGSLVIP